MSKAEFDGATLRFADLRNTAIADWQLSSAQDLTGVNLSRNDLSHGNLVGLDLSGADFESERFEHFPAATRGGGELDFRQSRRERFVRLESRRIQS